MVDGVFWLGLGNKKVVGVNSCKLLVGDMDKVVDLAKDRIIDIG